MNRHNMRIKAVQALYLLLDHSQEKDIDKETIERAIRNAFEAENKEIKVIPDYLFTVVNGVLTHEEVLEQAISAHLDNWKIENLNRIDSTILKLASYEILYVDDEATPDVVAIDEAIELTKLFSDKKTSALVNGVLQAIANESK